MDSIYQTSKRKKKEEFDCSSESNDENPEIKEEINDIVFDTDDEMEVIYTDDDDDDVDDDDDAESESESDEEEKEMEVVYVETSEEEEVAKIAPKIDSKEDVYEIYIDIEEMELPVSK